MVPIAFERGRGLRSRFMVLSLLVPALTCAGWEKPREGHDLPDLFDDVLYVHVRSYVNYICLCLARISLVSLSAAGVACVQMTTCLVWEFVQRLPWCGRLAEELLERTAIASGFRRRGDYEVLALLRRVEPALLTPLEVANQLLTSQSGMTGKLDRSNSWDSSNVSQTERIGER